ncbi:MAG: hypothetical protein KGL90_13390 [Burkholderiales bacterium]|nr:hypothetical protein [Burkholderiales bacterium]
MAQQQIIWTALPFGRIEEGPLKGRLRVSVVVSPRLRPDKANEQTLDAYQDFRDWPSTLSHLKFALDVNGAVLPLEPLPAPDLSPWTRQSLWNTLLPPSTPVAGFVFKDMSQVNLRSYPIRNVLGFTRKHYGDLAQQSSDEHPTLLPWRHADPALKGLLSSLGTATQTVVLGDRTIEIADPNGFNRFFDDDNKEGVEARLSRQVFGPTSRYEAAVVGLDGQQPAGSFPIRVLPPDWHDPALNGPDAALMSQFRTADEYTFYQATRFYRRQAPTAADLAKRRPDLKGVNAPIKPPEFDFHQIVASLADHPDLLRALGLILDFALPADNPIDAGLRGQPTVEGTLAAFVRWGVPHPQGASDPDSRPRTAFRASPERFNTRARTHDHADGLLRLAGTVDPTLPSTLNTLKDERSEFDVYQVDPDGAALKTTDFLVTAQNLVVRHLTPGTDGQVTYTTGDKQPVAALRSGGLGVLRHGRAAQVAFTAAATALKNKTIETTPAASNNIVLFIEDVLRGYRVDARHDQWRSLCWREGDYRLIKQADTPVPLQADEGYVKSASTTGDGGDDHYLHETLFRWTGWSLAAPRPGLTIKPDAATDSGLQGEQVGGVDEQAERGNGLAVNFKARKGTLPRLRFGFDYRFRARIVDLAGNSLRADDPGLGDLEQATEPVSYLRFEPVDPPALVHRHRVSEGESLERMVIRSNYNADTSAYLSSTDFVTETAKPASADFEYADVNERHLVPPKSSQLQCEQHGLFDANFDLGTPAAIKQAYATAAREAGTLLDSTPSAQLELVTPASVKDVATSTTLPLHLPKADNPTGDRLVGGQYIIHREALIDTPYLPDGAAAGVSIRAEAGHAIPGIAPAVALPLMLGPGAAVVPGPNQQPVLLVTYRNDWPDSQGLRLVFAERLATLDDGPCGETYADDGLPKWDPMARTLTLFLPKGRIARLRYASFVHPHFASHLGIPQWTDTAGQRQAVLQSALLGLHWMVTPYRSLVMVHATQQPVCSPRLQKLQARRTAGAHTADLDGWVQLHGPSSGKFEVQAQWAEWHDDPARDRPELVTLHGQLGEIPLSENHVNQFGLAAAAAANNVNSPNPNNPSPATPRSPGNRQDFGDTRFRLVTYHLVATTRFREYLPPSLFAQTDKVTRVGPPTLETLALVGGATDYGAPMLFNVAGAVPSGTIVPNTAPPASPQVVYAVPTFQWRQVLGAQLPRQTSTRFGNGLRVYLERPWFSSGDGELLGVVLLPDGAAFQGMRDALQPYVTQWGLDPLFDSALPKPNITAHDFPRAVASETVGLVELQDPADTATPKFTQPVVVVGHRVEWDDSRKLWFVDIELNPGLSYMPFVRLALVRYQPQSLPFAKISRVVQAEFAQVLPRRSAELSVQDHRVSVSLHGPVPDHGPMRLRFTPDADGPYSNVSVMPPLGSALESGRNRVELVLQTRDPAIDSDLAWSDVSTLASSLAVPPGGKIDTNGPSIFKTHAVSLTETQTTRTGRLGNPISFATQVPRIDTATKTSLGGGVITLPPGLFDPVIWQAGAPLPEVGGRPARLVLREFERYYTDRTVPEQHGGSQWRRRVVEERLVYAEFFPLN